MLGLDAAGKTSILFNILYYFVIKYWMFRLIVMININLYKVVPDHFIMFFEIGRFFMFCF